MKRIFFLLAMAGMAEGSFIAPFGLNLSQAGGPSALAGETFISGLDFPYELAVGTDGSLLFGQTESVAASGLTYGWGLYAVGSAWKLPNLGNGSFGSPETVSGDFSGIAVSVKPLSSGVLVVDSGAAGGGNPGGTGDRTMNFVSTTGQTIGTLSFAYPSTCAYECWEHGNGMSLVVPGSNGSNTVYFIVGSQADDTKTTATVSISGMGLNNVSLNADSVYTMTVQSTSGNSVQITSAPQQVATGLRNPFSLTVDAAGDLLIFDNGIDSAHNPNELSADTLDMIPRGMIGSMVYDFGFPDSYTDFDTGQRVNGDPNATPPLVALAPVADSSGTLQYCEGASAMVYLPAGSASFVGSQGGLILSCNGMQDTSGASNTDDAVMLYDIASGLLVPILDGGNPGFGHIDGLALIGGELFVEDMAASGSQDSQSGADTGAIYEFDLPQDSPEPGTLVFMAGGFSLLLLCKKNKYRSEKR